MFVWHRLPCGRAGGPVPSAPLEIEVDGNVYVLADDGPPEQWRHEFAATVH